MNITEIKAAAEESLSHTWAGREIPVGSSIPSAFRDAVRAEKANARNVLWLVERCEELRRALRNWHGQPGCGEKGCVACAALARLEGE